MFSMKVDAMITLTTLTTGKKGAHPSANRTSGGGGDAAAPLPLPHVQTFDDEVVSKPGRYFYTQMGAWEVQPAMLQQSLKNNAKQSVDPAFEPYADSNLGTTASLNGESAGSAAHGHVLRQMATVWPNCWNSQDCDPPKTWFGPAMFNDADADTKHDATSTAAAAGGGVNAADTTPGLKAGASFSMDVLLQDDGNISFALAPFGASASAMANASITLCTNGSWSVGSASGTDLAGFDAGKSVRVEVGRARGRIAATVGGRLLGNESVGTPASSRGNFTLRMMLSHYFVASIDNFVADSR